MAVPVRYWTTGMDEESQVLMGKASGSRLGAQSTLHSHRRSRMKRWKYAKMARYFDYNIVDKQVPTSVALLRFIFGGRLKARTDYLR